MVECGAQVIARDDAGDIASDGMALAVQKNGVGGMARGEVDVVHAIDDAALLAHGRAFQRMQHPHLLVQVQRGERDVDALSFATGERGHVAVGHGFEFEYRERAPGDVVAFATPVPERQVGVSRGGDRIPDRQAEGVHDRLRQETASPPQLTGPIAGQVATVQLHGTAIGRAQSGQGAQQRGLARAIRADHGPYLAAADPQVERIDQQAVLHDQPQRFGGEGRRHRRLASRNRKVGTPITAITAPTGSWIGSAITRETVSAITTRRMGYHQADETDGAGGGHGHGGGDRGQREDRGLHDTGAYAERAGRLLAAGEQVELTSQGHDDQQTREQAGHRKAPPRYAAQVAHHPEQHAAQVSVRREHQHHAHDGARTGSEHHAGEDQVGGVVALAGPLSGKQLAVGKHKDCETGQQRTGSGTRRDADGAGSGKHGAQGADRGATGQPQRVGIGQRIAHQHLHQTAGHRQQAAHAERRHRARYPQFMDDRTGRRVRIAPQRRPGIGEVHIATAA
ncbi:hypothetical protein KCV01_g2326, partial [Aureobasidium melanogenum]